MLNEKLTLVYICYDAYCDAAIFSEYFLRKKWVNRNYRTKNGNQRRS